MEQVLQFAQNEQKKKRKGNECVGGAPGAQPSVLGSYCFDRTLLCYDDHQLSQGVCVCVCIRRKKKEGTNLRQHLKGAINKRSDLFNCRRVQHSTASVVVSTKFTAPNYASVVSPGVNFRLKMARTTLKKRVLTLLTTITACARPIIEKKKEKHNTTTSSFAYYCVLFCTDGAVCSIVVVVGQ